jgi:RHH-type proline utilization regulon transcriptional repressor/proline dehydrogenase/delta 1-pyrroline-5-carboxylate dehydrogenase
MLLGMAEPIKGALRRLGQALREYTPTGELLPGMAYLVRRLLENTSNEGFLHKTFVDNAGREALLAAPEPWPGDVPPQRSTGIGPFANEPPLDFSVKANREACRVAIAQVRNQFGKDYPAVIGGREWRTDEMIVSFNPAHPEEVVGRVAGVSRELVDRALVSASEAQKQWGKKSAESRAELLFRAAAIGRGKRAELLAWQVAETGKNWAEADADVAEAIDYLEYYGREALKLGKPLSLGGLPGEVNRYHYQPRGTGVVIAPWNFPLAISLGMVSAALVAGNAVLYKPSSLAPVNGWQAFALLREAGVPDGVLNFIPGAGEVVGEYLAGHPRVNFIAFTGSRDVGLRIAEKAGKAVPGQQGLKRVILEMGGKNAVIVDDDADLDQAVTGVLQSAFGYQGQKCSACSRAIVLDGCYDRFMERFAAAVEGIVIGPPGDPTNFMGPMIDAKARAKVMTFKEMALKEGKVTRELPVPEGGHYVGPMAVTDLPHDSRLLREEIFGPLLAVIKVRDMGEALERANDTDYALTGGLYSRSPANIQRVTDEFCVGNLYINRPITGAIVGRQPFGGFRMSGVGSKAGGPDYLLQFMEPRVVTENTLRRGFTPEVIA